ncbi:MAG: type IV secretion system protein VirB4 [Rhodospirillaceae bacterium]|nr:type IV secretion system protein VirB4 [Rhodospirillales bacterium]
MWPLALGMGSAAVAAGALAVPAARRLVFGSVQFDWQGDELEFDRVDHDNMTVRLKSGTVMRSYRLGGLAYDTKPEQEQFALNEGRADFEYACASRGVIVRKFGVKRLRALHLDARWPSPALQEIGDAEAALYRKAYQLRWYMMLQAPSMQPLEEADEKVRNLLGAYRPVHLIRPTDPAADCPLTGFLNYLVCGDLRDDLRAVSSNVSANLPAASPLFDKATGDCIVHLPNAYHHRVIAISAWPDLLSGHLLHEIMNVPGEIEVSQVAVPIGKTFDQLMLKRAANNPLASNEARGEALAASELLNQGRTQRCNTQLAVIVRGRTETEIEDITGQICSILGNRRVAYSVETRAAPVIWYNRTPDHEKLPRPLKLFCENTASLWPFESAPTGLATSQYGDAPVRTFGTSSGQSYAFQFQCTPAPKALGNFLVIAPSRSGKSTLILHLLAGLAKFSRILSVIFDSKEGARFMVEVMGGLYQSFDRLAFNPLDCDDTLINRQRLALLMRTMLGEAGNELGIEDVLSHAVETAFQLPVEARTFNEIFPLVFPAKSDARQAFSRWVIDPKERAGLYAGTFNAPRDGLAGLLDQTFMTGINMNEALDDPNLGAPVVAHIANAMERMARAGRVDGFVAFIDEAAKLLQNSSFCKLGVEMYREYGKLKGAVGMAFQDPSALHSSGIGPAVIENTASFFFFANPQGNRDAYEPFNLNDEQKGFVFGAPEGRKVLLVKRDAATGFEESTILNIDLGPLGKPTRFYRSGPDAVRDLQEIQAKWGNEWPSHV